MQITDFLNVLLDPLYTLFNHIDYTSNVVALTVLVCIVFGMIGAIIKIILYRR